VLKRNLDQFQVIDFMLVTQTGGKGRDLKIWLPNFGSIRSKKNLLSGASV
jgi:hypothetical protein